MRDEKPKPGTTPWSGGETESGRSRARDLLIIRVTD